MHVEEQVTRPAVAGIARYVFEKKTGLNDVFFWGAQKNATEMKKRVWVNFDPYRRRYGRAIDERARQVLWSAVSLKSSLSFLTLSTHPQHAWLVTPWTAGNWPVNLAIGIEPDAKGRLDERLRHLEQCPSPNVWIYLPYGRFFCDHRHTLDVWLERNPAKRVWFVLDRIRNDVDTTAFDCIVTETARHLVERGQKVWVDGVDVPGYSRVRWLPDWFGHQELPAERRWGFERNQWHLLRGIPQG